MFSGEKLMQIVKVDISITFNDTIMYLNLTRGKTN